MRLLFIACLLIAPIARAGDLLPMPPEAHAGATINPADVIVTKAYANYAWIARLISEMDDETALDLKRAMQIRFHCQQFRNYLGAIDKSDAMNKAAAYFEFKDAPLPDPAALHVIRDHCLLIETAIDPGIYAGGFSTNVLTGSGDVTDVPIKVEKSEALARMLAEFRNLFSR